MTAATELQASSYRVTVRYRCSPRYRHGRGLARSIGDCSCVTLRLVDGSTGACVVVPDLPDCTSGGPTTDEALRNALEAVRLRVERCDRQWRGVASSDSVEALRANPEIAAALATGAILGMVPLVLDAGRAVRANLSRDAGLLDAIDEAAKAHGLTRSAFLVNAARENPKSSAFSHPCGIPRPGQLYSFEQKRERLYMVRHRPQIAVAAARSSDARSIEGKSRS